MLNTLLVRHAPSSRTRAVPRWTRAGLTERGPRRGAAQDAARRCAAGALLLLGLLLAPRSAAATEVSDELQLGQPTPVAAPGVQTAPAAACGAGGCLALWEETNVFPQNVLGRRILDGALVDPWPFEVTPRSVPQTRPDVAAGGPGYLVVWVEAADGADRRVLALRLDNDGAALDAEPLVVAEEDRLDSAAVASDGATFLVVWNTPNGLRARRVGRDGALLDEAPIDVAETTSGGRPPAVAYDGTNYLVVWSSPLGAENARVLGARVTPTGVDLDPESFAISPSSSSTSPSPRDRPVVACRPGECLVAWLDASEGTPGVAAARVTSEGTVLDAAGTSLVPGNNWRGPFAVAADSSGYLVVVGYSHHDDVTGVGEHRVSAKRVDGDTGLPDAALTLLSTTPEPDAEVTAAFDGAAYLVAWADAQSASSQRNPDIHAARLSSGGARLEANVLLSGVPNDQHSVAAAPSGDGFLAAWSEERTDGEPGRELRVAWTAPDGVVLGAPSVLATAAYYVAEPAVAFDGAQHAVVYFQDHTLAGALLDPTGQARAIDFSGWNEVWNEATPESPRLAWDGNDIVVASRFRGPSDAGGVQIGRIRAADKVTGPIALDVEQEPSAPDIACDSGICMVVWTASNSGELEARFLRGHTATRLSALSSFNAGPSTRPRVAQGGGRFLIVWGGPRADSAVHAALVAPDGELLAQADIPTTDRDAVVHEPAVAFDGERFVVAWIEQRYREDAELEACDVFAVRLSTTGEVSAPFAVTDTPSVVEEKLQVASNGAGRTLVAHDVYESIWGDTRGRRAAAHVLSDEVAPDGGAGGAGGDGPGGGGGEGGGGDAVAHDEGCGCRVAGAAAGDSPVAAIAGLVLCLAAAARKGSRSRATRRDQPSRRPPTAGAGTAAASGAVERL
ncbi:hypothetical protein AB3662_27005 [Sorangium cellulosum]|uniref:hypothetical protein n=1 Tax=Sorangium cellulosum TaxID=56 RepID=UPI003D9A7D88